MMSLRVHVFQHIAHEGLAYVGEWCQMRHAQVTCTAFYAWEQGEPLPQFPDPDQVDLLVIMGGAMSVNDDDVYPWLVAEKQWIARFIAANKPVVGLCLGAQLIANALGAEVRKNHQKEIGWWPVDALDASHNQNVFVFPKQIVPLSWHGDTFDLPEGAILLASSQACAHQAYQYGDHVLAFQFHPESTPKSLSVFLTDIDYQDFAGSHEFMLLPSELKKTIDEPERFVAPNQLLHRALDYVMRDHTNAADKTIQSAAPVEAWPIACEIPQDG